MKTIIENYDGHKIVLAVTKYYVSTLVRSKADDDESTCYHVMVFDDCVDARFFTRKRGCFRFAKSNEKFIPGYVKQIASRMYEMYLN